MKQRILTALAIILVVFFPLYLGGWLLRSLVFTVCAIASYELISLRNSKSDMWLGVFVFAMIVLFYNVPETSFVPILSFYIIVLFLLTICFKSIELTDVCYIFIISIMLSIAAKSIILISDYGYGMLLYLALACYGCDTGAYFFGYYFGKHKMIERISPKKTWEGAFGGWATGFVLSLGFGLFFVNVLTPVVLIVTSMLLPIVSQIGDLAFSAIKRHYKVKDFGSIFPGHGGVLDRVDSLVFSLMFLNAVLLVVR